MLNDDQSGYDRAYLLQLPRVGEIEYSDGIRLDIRAEKGDNCAVRLYHFLFRFPSQEALDVIETRAYEGMANMNGRFPNLADERTVLAVSIDPSKAIMQRVSAASDAIKNLFGFGLNPEIIMPMLRRYEKSIETVRRG